MSVHDLLKQRWSPRAFAPEAIEESTLVDLLEAARWAPSCYNDQPWSFIVARRGAGDAWERMLGCLVEFNQSWAQTAPVLMLAVARRGFARNGEPNRHAWYDTGQAMANLLVQATHAGLYVHQMAGFDAELARERFGIPDDHDAIAAAALGRLGDPSTLPEGMDEKDPHERERKPLAAFAFDGRWDAPLPGA